MAKTYTFTSESVCSGHPDKICDSISDAILDEVLRQDKTGRVAVETVATFNRLILVGEVTARVKIDYQKIAREQIKSLGYTDPSLNFSNHSPIETYIHSQSPEIAVGVHPKGAGDQGMMFGYACQDTTELMPMPITLAHALAEQIDFVRQSGILAFLKPDGKTQVTVEYKNDQPIRVTAVVIAVPHKQEINLSVVKQEIYKKVVQVVLEKFGFKISIEKLIVNGTGIWHMSGPAVDSGLTGRKIVVDTYGGMARVGGGCFSGKDPTKVDRSGAYAARFIAKNIVAQKLAQKVEVRLAYFIGAKKPLMQQVETFGTSKVSQKAIDNFASKILDTSVAGILSGLKLLRPIYLKTASYGHFGRPEFPWEKIKQV